MSHSPFTPDDPRLTAYVLGELEPIEVAALETALADSPDLQRVVDELRTTSSELFAALQAEPMPSGEVELAAPQIETATSSAASPPRRRGFLLVNAVTLLLLIGVVVGLQGPPASVPQLSREQRLALAAGLKTPDEVAIERALAEIKAIKSSLGYNTADLRFVEEEIRQRQPGVTDFATTGRSESLNSQITQWEGRYRNGLADEEHLREQIQQVQDELELRRRGGEVKVRAAGRSQPVQNHVVSGVAPQPMAADNLSTLQDGTQAERYHRAPGGVTHMLGVESGDDSGLGRSDKGRLLLGSDQSSASKPSAPTEQVPRQNESISRFSLQSQTPLSPAGVREHVASGGAQYGAETNEFGIVANGSSPAPVKLKQAQGNPNPFYFYVPLQQGQQQSAEGRPAPVVDGVIPNVSRQLGRPAIVRGSQVQNAPAPTSGQKPTSHTVDEGLPYSAPFYPATAGDQFNEAWGARTLNWSDGKWTLDFADEDWEKVRGEAEAKLSSLERSGVDAKTIQEVRGRLSKLESLSQSEREVELRKLAPAKQPADKAQDGYYAGHYFMLDVLDAGLQEESEAFYDDVPNEAYNPIVENDFTIPEGEAALSTFSLDVDTASYSNVRRFLTQQQLPPPDAVRIEELVNYFDYDLPQPEGEDPFSVTLDATSCPWQPQHRLVRIGLQGREIDMTQRPLTRLVFLLDVSGSMSDANKLPLVKDSMKLLVKELGENDRIAIVTYSNTAELKLDSAAGHEQETILAAIDSLDAGGSTNGAGGIQLAYETATKHFLEDASNRVILCTDGDFNVGVSDDDELVKMIEEKRESGVFLSIFGYGMGNIKDAKLESLADKGNGHYGYIDDLDEARKVFVEELTGMLYTIAKDVKLQVEFNPAKVGAYRLLGYENRMLAAKDFNNDAVDAGEMGAGHTVTALYEIVPAGLIPQRPAKPDPAVDPLKYQSTLSTASPTPGGSAGDQSATRKLAEEITRAFDDTGFSGAEIRIEVNGRNVTAQGTVPTAEQRAKIDQVADSFADVTFENKVTVTPPKAASDELLTVKLRYKQPDGEESTKLEFPLDDEPQSCSPDLQFAASVTGFGLLLRNSRYAAGCNWDLMVELAEGARGDDENGRRGEFIDLARQARRLWHALHPHGRHYGRPPQMTRVETPAGVVHVNDATRRVWINLGSQDGLRPQALFCVYGRKRRESAPDATDLKARIEVVSVDQRSAMCRILREDVKRPIAKGDLIVDISEGLPHSTVTEVSEGQFVAISNGSREGLMENDVLKVIRVALDLSSTEPRVQYLGKLRLVVVQSDVSIGQFAPADDQATIAVGDRVVSEL